MDLGVLDFDAEDLFGLDEYNQMENQFNEVDQVDNLVIRIPRHVKRTSYFETYTNKEFFERFRLSKNSAFEVLSQIEEHLQFTSARNKCLSPMNQFLICLRAYATGGHLLSLSDIFGPSKSSVCRIVQRVTPLIASLRPRYIKLPNNVEEVREQQNKWYEIRGFPRVVGCIDGTHIKITSPGGNDAEIYRNRKGYFSINVQAICSAEGLFQNITARWPGSAHDQTILNNSVVKQRFIRGDFANGVLLGDGGYTCTNFLLTPLRDPQTNAERSYNEAHIGTRVKVEHLFGVWKRRFPIIAYGCRLNLRNVLAIIVATACLHNVAVRQGEPQPPANDDIGEYIVMDDNDIVPAGNRNNNNIRRHFIENYFTQA